MTKPHARALPLSLLLAAGCGGSEMPIDAATPADAASAPDTFVVADDAATPTDAGTDAFSPDAPRRPPLERFMTLPQRIACPPALGFREDGTPVVAVVNMNALRVYEQRGASWTQIGPDVTAEGISIVADGCPGLVVSGDDTIYVAFEQVAAGSTYTAHVQHLAGAAWVDDFTVPSPSGHAVVDIDVDRDSSGEPVIAMLERNATAFGYGVAIRRRVGGTFVRAPMLDTLTVGEVRIAVRPDDTVVAAITHTVGPFGTGVGILELSPTDVWTTRDDVDLVGDTTQGLTLTGLDADATRSWITWVRGTSGGERFTHLSELIGNTYRSLDPEEFHAQYPDVAHRDGDVLAWAFADDFKLTVQDYDGTGFGAPLVDMDSPVNIVSLQYHGDDLWAACTTTFGGGPADALIVRVTFPE
ncbi:MAG: hypothetical protein J0L92_27425 [Deltaproteobacteria bacterium]|nr:hypothetical protein [Deltaproteobacteria bacterium]